MAPSDRLNVRDSFSTSDAGQSNAWMVTFADLIALVLTFFVLMYSMSSVPQDDWEDISKSLSQRLLLNKNAITTYVSSDLTVDRISTDKGSDLEYLFTILEDKLKPFIEEQKIVEVGLVDDKIIISLVGDNFFLPGSAELPQNISSILQFISQTLNYTKNHVEIISYADPSPIENATFPSNWELSLQRAVEVSNTLRKYGYPYNITAFGRSSSLFGELSPDVPLGRRQKISRRVDIIVRGEKASY